jgi:predicted AAA+ superfamily ATPase
MDDVRINTAGFVIREKYLSAMEAFIDQPVVKVLKGMRRVGKSVLMRLLIGRLMDKGVPGANILYINKESLEFDALKDYLDLYRYARDYFQGGGGVGKKYILIDEIQEIASWERAVASFLADGLGDVVISGSNARLLSSELATLISGRYVEIPVYPLTFREFLTFRHPRTQENIATATATATATDAPGQTNASASVSASTASTSTSTATDTDAEFSNYLKYGGLPGIHQLPVEDEVIFIYLNSILNTVLYKDVITRHKIRDASIFDMLVRYLFDNVGNITTAKKIADYFKSQRIRTSVDTILNYINYIEASLLIDKAPRYDIKGKRRLEFSDKVFLNDIGLRHGLIGYRESDINGLLENVVFKELQARGYKMSIGVLDQMEIDFIAEKQNEKKYIQVCYSLGGEGAVAREFGNLEKIRDNYEKIVISMDRFFPAGRNGVMHRYITDFLLE